MISFATLAVTAQMQQLLASAIEVTTVQPMFRTRSFAQMVTTNPTPSNLNACLVLRDSSAPKVLLILIHLSMPSHVPMVSTASKGQ